MLNRDLYQEIVKKKATVIESLKEKKLVLIMILGFSLRVLLYFILPLF